MSRELINGFLNTPPLWTKEQFGIVQFEMENVFIDIPNTLEIPRNLRLGYQMEYVFSTLITHHPNFELLAKNLLIDEGNRRIGELDFILRNKVTHQVFHIELAYKFYLIDPTISQPIYRLIGPNRRDMFYTKLDKVKEKQFPLLYHTVLKPIWENLKIKLEEVTQMVCFKAQLFSPFSDNGVSIRPLNKKCLAGYWVGMAEFQNNALFKACTYYIPLKIEWVVAPQQTKNYSSHFEAIMEVNLRHLNKNAPMLWMKKPDETLVKLFVVWW